MLRAAVTSALLLLVLSGSAGADDGAATNSAPATALPSAADVADLGLQGWWRDGELLVGHPSMEGRPGLRPLADLRPVILPPDLDDWAEVGGTCVARPESRARREGRELVARATASQEGPVIQVLDGSRVVAVNALGRPARVCEILLAQADGMPGLEVVVAWRMEGGPAARASAEDRPAATDAATGGGSPAEPPAAGEGSLLSAPAEAPELRGFTVYRLPESAR